MKLLRYDIVHVSNPAQRPKVNRGIRTVAKHWSADLEMVYCPSQTQLKTALVTTAVPSAIQGRKECNCLGLPLYLLGSIMIISESSIHAFLVASPVSRLLQGCIKGFPGILNLCHFSINSLVMPHMFIYPPPLPHILFSCSCVYIYMYTDLCPISVPWWSSHPPGYFSWQIPHQLLT